MKSILANAVATGTLLGAMAASALEGSPRLIIGDTAVRTVPNELFGQFLERASWHGELGPEGVCDDQGRLPDRVEAALAALHAPIVRFPFGTAGDYIDWQDLIDLPGRDKRPSSIDHFGNTVTNRFGLPEYFGLARRMGWKTILVGNLRDALYGKRAVAEAAEHAAALLRYGVDHAPHGGIAAFQIGNEGWFFWPPEPEKRAALGVTDLGTAALRLREALIAYADTARRVAPEVPLICDAPRPDDGGGLENDAGLVWRLAVDHPDIRSRFTYLAAHAYAPMGMWSATRDSQKVSVDSLSEDDVWFGLLSALGRFDARGQNIADARAYDEISELGFQAAVTEWNWNGWDLNKRFPQVTFLDGMPAALGAAGFLHGLMRHPSVALATQSMMLGSAWGITSVRVLPDGSVVHGPQAEVVRLYSELHGSSLLGARLENVPVTNEPVALASWWPESPAIALLDAIVTANPGRLYVHLIQRSRTDELPLAIRIPAGSEGAGPARLTMLTGDNQSVTTTGLGRLVRSQREIAAQGATVSLTLPPASVSVLEIPVAAHSFTEPAMPR